MLNAIQQRMLEEALVEKEVYEAMQTLRAKVGEIVGTMNPNVLDPDAPPPITRGGRPALTPQPVAEKEPGSTGGTPQTAAAQAHQPATRTPAGAPATRKRASTSTRPPLPELPQGTPPPNLPARKVPIMRKPGSQFQRPAADGQPAQPTAQPSGDTGIPSDVLAVGDPLRNPQQRVQPYIPVTDPKTDRDPFPQLGMKGRPLG